MKAKLIYRDEKFEDETRAGIRVTHEATLKLWDIWTALNLGTADLWQLINNASKIYSDAFQANVEVPETIGTYKLNKSAFLNIIEVPVPNDLYIAARAVQKTPCYGYQNIWSIKDGKVFQDEEQVEAVVHSRNIYAYNEHQLDLGKSVIEFVRLSNYLDQQFKEIPWNHIPAMPWTNNGRSFPNLHMLTLEVEQLRVIMGNLQE